MGRQKLSLERKDPQYERTLKSLEIQYYTWMKILKEKLRYLIWEGYAAYIHESRMHVEVNRKGKNIYKGLREEEKGPAKAPHAGV